ncbi:MAG TPA: hypothetical protein VMT17_18455 [Anaeromyxobacteraceae bacterium]|nr:hypothetical protein [Anaeromyxobacteraceae bacterium]
MKASNVAVGLLAMLALASARADAPALAVAISGALPRSGTLAQQDLEALGAATTEWVDHGERHTVTGVPVEKALLAFGFAPGPKGKHVPVGEKRGGWRKVLVAIGRDGYQVAFSCAELSPEIGATRALLVWAMDGKPLREATGPLRLVVLTDHEPARSVQGLVRLVVVDATQPRGTP